MLCILCRSICTSCTAHICMECLSRFSSLYSPCLIDVSKEFDLKEQLYVYSMFPYEGVVRELINLVKVEENSYALDCFLYLWSYFLDSDESISIDKNSYTLSMPYSLYSRIRLKYPLASLMRVRLDNIYKTIALPEYWMGGFDITKRSRQKFKGQNPYGAPKVRKTLLRDLIIVDDVVTTGYSYARLSGVYKANNVLGLCFAYSPGLSFRKN